MISKFVTVYPGHIDLPRHGPGRRRRPTSGATPTSSSPACSRRPRPSPRQMDALGYDTLWLAEHHFQHEGYECIPNILMLAVHLAHVTKRLRIGCGFNIAPMWHPLRLAEDYRGRRHPDQGPHRVRRRPRLSHARGRDLRRADAGPDANRELFEEQVEIIFKAFNSESFSHKGKHYTLPPDVPYRGYTLKELTLVPRPGQPAGRMLAADRQRQRARARLHGQARHQGRGRRRRRDHGGGADPGLSRCRGARGQGPEARREPHRRHLLLPRRQPRAGDPRDDALLRGAREDVRAAGLRAGHHAGSRSPPPRAAAAGRRPACRRSTTT